MARLSLRLTLALLCLSAGVAEAGYYPLWVRNGFSDLANVRGIAAADFNSDGRPDVLAHTSNNQIHLFVTGAGGTLGSPASIYSGSTLTDIAVADVDGNGKPDVVAVEAGALTVLLSNGDGTFQVPLSSTLAISESRLATADFTSDGKVDVAVSSFSSSAAALYAGDGAGNFSLLLQRSLPSAPTSVEAGDIDADGKADYILGFTDGTPFEIYFGNGDGTFAAAVFVASPAVSGSSRIALADLDADGDSEIVLSHFNAQTLTVVVNNGSRTFGSPAIYQAPPPSTGTGNPAALVVGDVNGDGDADVVMVLANARLLATYTGNGDGSLNSGAYRPVPSPFGDSNSPLYLAAADFSGDGRVDLALASITHLDLWLNASGDVTVTLEADFPTITAGQNAKFTVTVDDAQGFYFSPHQAAVPTGTVTLRREGLDIGNAALSDGVATIEVPSLPLGTHTITAHYSGDDSYRTGDPDSAEQIVIAESTTVTVTSSAAGTEVPYGEQFSIEATVTSPLPDALDGELTLYVDGVPVIFTRSGPSANWDYEFLAPGTHTFQAAFGGTAKQPPSVSPVITQVVKKGMSITSLPGDLVVKYSSQPNRSITVWGTGSSSPKGTVHLYEGLTLRATANVTSGDSVQVPVSLPVGTHYLHATFDGNEFFEPSSSSLIKYLVLPDEGFVIDVWAQGSSITAFGLYAPPSGGHFKVYRRTPATGWFMFQRSSPSWTEHNAAAATPYTFFMEAYNSSNQLVATSNADVAMRYTFTDDPLAAGTIIKSQHLTELETATNTLRGAAGLSAISIETLAGHMIRATHVLELRSAINEARLALGAAAIAFSADVAPGSAIKAAHIQQLRDAIR